MRGTTSACAENTSLGASEKDIKGNYLRVRGEYMKTDMERLNLEELPPRARRIHSVILFTKILYGTTSACAENTLNELGLL